MPVFLACLRIGPFSGHFFDCKLVGRDRLLNPSKKGTSTTNYLQNIGNLHTMGEVNLKRAINTALGNAITTLHPCLALDPLHEFTMLAVGRYPGTFSQVPTAIGLLRRPPQHI